MPAYAGDNAIYGFVIRNNGMRQALNGPRNRSVHRPVEQLLELVGRVSLKDMVRESSDMIERLCIEAALERSGDNRASAAQMLASAAEFLRENAPSRPRRSRSRDPGRRGLIGRQQDATKKCKSKLTECAPGLPLPHD